MIDDVVACEVAEHLAGLFVVEVILPNLHDQCVWCVLLRILWLQHRCVQRRPRLDPTLWLLVSPREQTQLSAYDRLARNVPIGVRSDQPFIHMQSKSDSSGASRLKPIIHMSSHWNLMELERASLLLRVYLAFTAYECSVMKEVTTTPDGDVSKQGPRSQCRFFLKNTAGRMSCLQYRPTPCTRLSKNCGTYEGIAPLMVRAPLSMD